MLLVEVRFNYWVKKVGFLYFGVVIDFFGQCECVGFEEVYFQYDVIFADDDIFGQIILINGQKV